MQTLTTSLTSFEPLNRHSLDQLFGNLLNTRRTATPAEWCAFCSHMQANPGVEELILQEPMTRRANLKPRGYAGDAVMMDYLYGIHSSEEEYTNSTELGRKLFRYIQSRPAGRAVRFRREHIAGLIDETAQRTPSAQILSVACGHLREAELSSAVSSGALARFIALDADCESLAEVERCYGQLGIETIHASVRHLLTNKCPAVGQSHFVYAAGLYDYLNTKVAMALTARLFNLTAPGGLLLIPNFTPETQDRAYMEAVMDWHLIYRDEYDMHNIAQALPAASIGSYEIYRDPSKAVVYLAVRKR